jgi:hypothetical protein
MIGLLVHLRWRMDQGEGDVATTLDRITKDETFRGLHKVRVLPHCAAQRSNVGCNPFLCDTVNAV